MNNNDQEIFSVVPILICPCYYTAIVALNTCVFLLWRVPVMQRVMEKNFLSTVTHSETPWLTLVYMYCSDTSRLID